MKKHELAKELAKKERVICDAYLYYKQCVREAYSVYLRKIDENKDFETVDVITTYAIYVRLLQIQHDLENILYEGRLGE